MQPNIIERVWRQDKGVNIDVLNGFVFTGEAGAHKFVISGKNVNTPVSISGTVTANFKNADGVLVPLTGTIEDGKAVVVLSQECYAVEGPFSLMIFADTVCIYAAIANVINSSGEVIAYPTATIPSVQELIEEVQDVIASIPQDYSALNAHFPATGKFVSGNGTANKDYSSVFGYNNIAGGMGSHAEGWTTIASGNYSHTEGTGTIATHRDQHVFGRYNAPDPSTAIYSTKGTYVEIVGNGTSEIPSNARTLDWNGNEELSGSLKVGNGVTVNNVTLSNNTLNQPNLLTFNQCNELQLIYEENLGDVVHTDEVYLSMQQIKNLLSMLSYYQGITPFTASEISALRALIGGGGQTSDADSTVTANDGTVFSSWRCELSTSASTSDYPNATAVYEVTHHAGESSFTIKIAPGYNYESIAYFIDSATVGTQYNESTGVTVNENGTASIIKFNVHKPAVNQQSEGAVVEYVILVSVGGEEEPVTEEPVTEEPVTEEPVAEDP